MVFLKLIFVHISTQGLCPVNWQVLHAVCIPVISLWIKYLKISYNNVIITYSNIHAAFDNNLTSSIVYR